MSRENVRHRPRDRPDEVLDRFGDALFAVDRDLRLTFVNEPARDLLGLDGDPYGRPIAAVAPGLADASFESELETALATGEPARFEADFEPRDARLAVRAHPSETGLSAYLDEVTERRERGRDAAPTGPGERLRMVMESSDEAMMAKDREGRYLAINDAGAAALGRPREEVVGRTDVELFGEERGREMWERERRVVEERTVLTYEEELPTVDGPRVYDTSRVPFYGPDGGVLGTIGICRDVTGRKERERELRRYETLVETSPDPMLAIDDDRRVTLANGALEELLGVDREALLGERVEEWRDRGVLREADYECAVDLLADLLAADGSCFERLEVSLDPVDGDRVDVEFHLTTLPPAGPEAGPDGIVGVARDISGHKQQERQIRSQRDELRKLARINGLVRELIHSLVGASTRAEIEETVCDQLAASEFYSGTWIAERETGTEGVRPRTAAGFAEEYIETLDSLDASVTGSGGADIALRTGDVQVVQRIDGDPRVPTPMQKRSLDSGFESCIVVPLTHRDTVYGALVVNATAPEAFTERVTAAFELLGDVVGFAINAVQNERLLLGDSRVEVELRVREMDAFFIDISERLDCRCVLQWTVPAADGRMTHYVSVEGAPPDAVLELADDAEEIENIRPISDADDGSLFEVVSTVSAPKTLFDVGANPTKVVTEGGLATVVAEVPPDADVGAIVETFRRRFGETDLVAKREVDRPVRTAREFREDLADRLTDRQHSVLRAAYFAGYYDWPRASTAEEVAGSLEISSATLHYHLRKAERDLLAAFFGGQPAP